MGREPDARLVADARRFHTRRLIHALVRRDTALFDEPTRRQSISLWVSWLAGVSVAAVCAASALIVPPDSTGDAPIVMVRDTGALYVRIEHRLHPVFNLTSARLIARSPANPVPVTASAAATAEHGPALGIPGAPAQLGRTVHVPVWMACDAEQTTVFAGGPVDQLHEQAVPVLSTPAGDNSAVTYLLYDGGRAEVDRRDIAAVRALRIDGVVPTPISRVLLDLLPELPTITAPTIADVGTLGAAGYRIGQVLRMVRAGSTEYYVVLAHGFQRVGEVAADLIRFTYGVGGGDVPVVNPEAVASVEVVNELAVATFPVRVQAPGSSRDVCVRWQPGGTSAVLAGTPSAVRATQLAQADGAGPHVDAVALAGGQSTYVRAVGVTGDRSGGPLYVMTDSGVLYGIRDEQTAGYLGLSGPPVDAPWPLLAQLPQGPELAVEAAELQRDTLPARP